MLYTTSGGANICSSSNGKVIVSGTEENGTIYQALQIQNGEDSDIADDEWVTYTITPAKLKNSDNPYTETAKAADTLTYTYTDGFWQHNGVAQWDYTTTDSSMNKSVSHSKIYATLANAVTAYGGTGYIQMLTPSTAATTIDKAVLIDLNGKPVSGVTVTTTGIQFMDTTANGYETPQGKLTVVSGIDNINLVSTYENGTTKKHYVKVANKDTDGKLDGTHSFHRAGVSLTGIQYTIGTDYVLFQGIFRGNETVAGALKRVGFQFSDSGSTWRVVEEKEKVGTMHPFTYARALPEAAISAEALLDFGAEPYAESLLRTSITLPST